MTRLHPFAALSLIFALVASVSAGEFSSKFVKSLSAANFKKEVLSTDRATIATFYAPWCGHCKRLAPEYEKAAKNMAGLVDFVAVDCDQDKNKPICAEYGVQGFPTVKIFSGAPKSKPSDYMGERTAQAIVQQATRAMPSFSKRIKTISELQKVVAKVPKQPVVFLFTDKIAVPSLYKALSADYHNSFTFYTIKDDPEFADMKNTFGITKTPTLLLWKGADEIEMYGGPLKIGHISHWLKQAVKKQRKPDFDATKDEL